jgi:Flp pilus assembly pilin Flp
MAIAKPHTVGPKTLQGRLFAPFCRCLSGHPRFWADYSGQALLEYGFAIVVVAVIVLAVFVLIGPIVADWFTQIVAAF